jgi:hypothetical protein
MALPNVQIKKTLKVLSIPILFLNMADIRTQCLE